MDPVFIDTLKTIQNKYKLTTATKVFTMKTEIYNKALL